MLYNLNSPLGPRPPGLDPRTSALAPRHALARRSPSEGGTLCRPSTLLTRFSL